MTRLHFGGSRPQMVEKIQRTRGSVREERVERLREMREARR